MAFFQIEYSSDVLGEYRQVDVIYPDRDQIAETESDTDIPVLYLLHGMGAIIILGPSVPIFSVSFVRLISSLLCLTLKMAGIQIPTTGLSITMPLLRSFLKSCNVSSLV